MTSSSQPRTKAEQLFAKAVSLRQNGATFRTAADKARLPLSTFKYCYDRKNLPKVPRTYILQAEERIVVDFINRYSDRGLPLKKDDVLDAFKSLVHTFSKERRSKLPFINGRPGKKILRLFLKQHADAIRFKRPSKEEEAR